MTTGKERFKKARAPLSQVTIEGIEGPVFIKPGKVEQVRGWVGTDDGDEQSIAASVVNEAGKPILTAEDARELDYPVFRELVRAVLRANGFSERAISGDDRDPGN